VKKAVLAGIFFLLMSATALPAHAATTSTTFVLTAGSLSISAPASKNLGSAATGSATISAQLGTTTVTDNRGALLGSWTSTVSSTSYTTGGGTANETIPNSAVTYWSGGATASSGTGTFTPGQATSGNAVALSSSQTAFSASAVVGNNTVSWNPTVTVNIPSAAVAGTYSGTITHSVA
jgi:hypothetical protein